jgi:hypothetical protein
MDPISDYYSQDVIRPVRIEHGFDFMLTSGGDAMEFMYNFLDYYFVEEGEQVTARHYLDEPHEISLQVTSREGLQTPFIQKVLVFLGMRYPSITWLADDGYTALPDAVEKDLADRIQAHVKAKGVL